MLRLGNGPGHFLCLSPAVARTNEQFIISSCPPALDPGDYMTTGLHIRRNMAQVHVTQGEGDEDGDEITSTDWYVFRSPR